MAGGMKLKAARDESTPDAGPGMLCLRTNSLWKSNGFCLSHRLNPHVLVLVQNKERAKELYNELNKHPVEILKIQPCLDPLPTSNNQAGQRLTALPAPLFHL
ncbi:hypothetical protein AG4045_019371 [Apium graveolens]|uniref:Uncharacterized protein n=1 Tax=Apium graveolens TaxID=4045 RepID=A0A6L5B850_APIGR|nr:hypothetical protein AG4045_019371 [Apium graveolens]